MNHELYTLLLNMLHTKSVF